MTKRLKDLKNLAKFLNKAKKKTAEVKLLRFFIELKFHLCEPAEVVLNDSMLDAGEEVV